MGIKWTRIDDRLIHGQVATSWLRNVNAEQVICISDSAAANPVQIKVLQMAAPDLMVHVFGVDKFIKIFNSQPIKRSTFLILESTSDALKLIENNVAIDYINYGGMRSREGRTQYAPELCFSEVEEEALKELNRRGIKVDYQVAAFDSPTDLNIVLEKAKKGAKEV